MPANYDLIANHYDWLSRLIFQKSQVRAQTDLIPFIKPPCKILLIGGGTGWLLEELAMAYPAGIELTYLDNSSNMIAIAKKRDFGQNIVSFIQTDIEKFETHVQFNVVMTPFLFDNLSSEKAHIVFEKINTMLPPGGLFLYTDFQTNPKKMRFWHRALLKLMYTFFKMVSNVETAKMPDIHPLLTAKLDQAIWQKTYFGEFIQSTVYQKT
jgi:ubiquinone/menaquinone biosynthesis C-methylase UbiE